MTPDRSLLDLAALADRRSRRAAVLGRLLLAEPDEDVAGVVRAVPALAPLASADRDIASDFERLLLREVPVYESVFLGEDGARGGEVAAAVADLFARHEFDETDRWRVAGVDHLGLELRLLAHLCALEATAWACDRPDEAVRIVAAERELLAEHLGRWGQVAADALRDRAEESPYGVLAGAVSDAVADEVERLRPEPDHPGLAPMEVRRPPRRLGPARLAQWLLAPATCGAWLSSDDLAAAAAALGVPWRRPNPRSRFREVVESAVDGDDLVVLLEQLVPSIERWRDRHVAREAAEPGAARRWRCWKLQAEETLALLDRSSTRHASPDAGRGPVVVVVRGPGADHRTTAALRAVDRLRALGARVVVSAEVDRPIPDPYAALLAAGVHEVLLVSGGISTIAYRDEGRTSDRTALHLPEADVVVRIVADDRPASVAVESGRDPRLTAAVERALA